MSEVKSGRLKDVARDEREHQLIAELKHRLNEGMYDGEEAKFVDVFRVAEAIVHRRIEKEKK